MPKKFNWDSFWIQNLIFLQTLVAASGLSKLDWSTYLNPEDTFDIEHGLEILTSNINNAIDIFAPDKKLNFSKTKYPWINTDLRLLRSKQDATSRRYSRTGLPALAKAYEEK